MASNETDPVRFFDVLNRTIHDNVARIGADTSLTLAVRDYKNGEVRLSGQHEEMIVARGGGEIDLLDTLELAFPIGLEDDISDFIHEKRIQRKPGEGTGRGGDLVLRPAARHSPAAEGRSPPIVLYTDGLHRGGKIPLGRNMVQSAYAKLLVGTGPNPLRPS